MPPKKPIASRAYLITGGAMFIASGIAAYYLYMSLISVVVLIAAGIGGLITAFWPSGENDTKDTKDTKDAPEQTSS